MKETLELRLKNCLCVSSQSRKAEGYFKKIIMPQDTEDFELVDLDKKEVSQEDIKKVIIDFYQEQSIPISLSINTSLEIIRKSYEIPRIGISMTYYGASAKITVMNLKGNNYSLNESDFVKYLAE